MFRFDFQEDGDFNDRCADMYESKLKWAEGSEICIAQEHFAQIQANPTVSTYTCGAHKIQHILPDMKYVNDSCVLEAELKHSDLIPGKYEGGLKIWECTDDLANFMINEISHMFHPGVSVLDLGCGAGILGLLALLRGCTVHFQDYNDSVLNTLTIPNVLLNLTKEENTDKIAKCRFFSGDWLSFTQYTISHHMLYDIILTSETIYNPENYYKLHTTFRKKLKNTGSIFLAAKTCYFGVGGSLRLFENFLAEGGYFTCAHCWSSKEGVQREIVQLKYTANVDV